jgi:hypothetical protein
MAVVVPPGLQPLGPALASPARRAGSVRRTSTIDATWERDARDAPMHLFGRSRDLFTPVDGSTPIVLREDTLNAVAGPDRVLTELSTTPELANLDALVGLKGGLRARIVAAFPELVEQGPPLYLLLDDISGVTLVSGFAFTHWDPAGVGIFDKDIDPAIKSRKLSMVNICAGFQEGSSALGVDGPPAKHSVQPVVNLPIGEDPLAWHELFETQNVSARRARRIDVWREGNDWVIDAFFQDSGTSPSGQRIAVHEYTIAARVDSSTGIVTAIKAIPQVLPFQECPMATIAVGRLVGQRIRDFRTVVNELLPGSDGCTHMNDTLRALAEVPVLVEYLPT